MAAVTTHAERGVDSLSAFEVVPTGKALGAEVHGVDFSQPVPEHGRVGISAHAAA